MSPRSRIDDAAWLYGQILALAESAAESAAEDADSAKRADKDDRDRYVAMSGCSTHYAKELRRILAGMTFEEALAKKLKGRR